MLAFAMVHEMPSSREFFLQTATALKRGGVLLLAEPAGHVSQDGFEKELDAAAAAGFAVDSRPAIRRSMAAVLRKS